MCDIVFEFPKNSHENAVNEFKKEFFSNNEKVINGSSLLDKMNYKEWLVFNERNRLEETVAENWVVSSTFFAIRKSDNKIIGIIDIRHNLENEILSNYGGHIGYSVRPSERRKGYATKMLKMALEYTKSIGLDKVMIGCYTDNVASSKTIIKYGGKLTESKLYLDGKPMQIYWINIK